MKHINNLWVKINLSLVIGFLFAGAGTKITYTCMPETPDGGCVSYEKAIMHPADLLKNKQSSFLHFSETFVIVSLVSFVLISVTTGLKKNQTSK